MSFNVLCVKSIINAIKLVELKFFTLLKTTTFDVCLILCFVSLSAVFHSTDSGGSRRSSQDSYQGLSDSGSAEEVEECELQGRERE